MLFRFGLQLSEALQSANQIDNWIEKEVEYAFDESLGYIMYETSRQSRFDARYWMLGAGARV